MTSVKLQMVRAFIEYANDAEGMKYQLTMKGNKWHAKPLGNYAPEVMHAVERNFKQDWGTFGN